MNLAKRLYRLEQHHPTKVKREPLLLEFIGHDETNPEMAGILYNYDGSEPRYLTPKDLEAIK